MKKTLSIAVDDQDLIELIQILADDDAESALAFLKQHYKSKARELLEGG
jgi:DNA polymerase III gamma/tau subunit